MAVSDGVSRPKVIHRDNSQEAKRLKKLIKAFGEELERTALEEMNKGKKGWDQMSDGPQLLELRKRLVENVKEGMLERKDQENHIGLLAAMVWFNRLEKERRDQILEAW